MSPSFHIPHQEEPTHAIKLFDRSITTLDLSIQSSSAKVLIAYPRAGIDGVHMQAVFGIGPHTMHKHVRFELVNQPKPRPFTDGTNITSSTLNTPCIISTAEHDGARLSVLLCYSRIQILTTDLISTLTSLPWKPFGNRIDTRSPSNNQQDDYYS